MGERRPFVLICDDEPALRELVRVSLGDSYRYREAGTVTECMNALGGRAPHLVVLDLMLTGGSGLEVLRAIRSAGGLSQTRVVVISAWSDDANRAAVEREGADAFVAKPFAPESLADRVEELLA